jgi:hypothetical protein
MGGGIYVKYYAVPLALVTACFFDYVFHAVTIIFFKQGRIYDEKGFCRKCRFDFRSRCYTCRRFTYPIVRGLMMLVVACIIGAFCSTINFFIGHCFGYRKAVRDLTEKDVNE